MNQKPRTLLYLQKEGPIRVTLWEIEKEKKIQEMIIGVTFVEDGE